MFIFKFPPQKQNFFLSKNIISQIIGTNWQNSTNCFFSIRWWCFYVTDHWDCWMDSMKFSRFCKVSGVAIDLLGENETEDWLWVLFTVRSEILSGLTASIEKQFLAKNDALLPDPFLFISPSISMPHIILLNFWQSNCKAPLLIKLNVLCDVTFFLFFSLIKFISLTVLASMFASCCLNTDCFYSSTDVFQWVLENFLKTFFVEHLTC